MADNIKDDTCNQSEIGKKMLETFTQERIQSDKVNLWSTMKKRKLMTWKRNSKKMKVHIQDKVVELQEDRSLFARMMMVSRSRPEIDIEEAIGKYEFTVVPRSHVTLFIKECVDGYIKKAEQQFNHYLFTTSRTSTLRYSHT